MDADGQKQEERNTCTPNLDVPNVGSNDGIKHSLTSMTVDVLSSSPNLRSSALDEIGRHNSNPEANPLHSPWTFWFENSPRKESYGDFGLKRLCEVKNIKAFWGVVNNITPVPQLQERTGYHLMRGDTVPTWEGNMAGGYWSMMCRKDRTQDVWTEILLASVGEQLSETVSEGDDVVGVSVRIRDREDMIQIWNKDSSLAHESTVMSKMKLLCSDLEFKEKYISCREKMQFQQPPPPKDLPSGPYGMPPPLGGPPGFFPPYRQPINKPHSTNFQSTYLPHPHPFRQHGPPPGPHPQPRFWSSDSGSHQK